MKQESVLEVKNLEFSFHTYGGVVKAVRDVSFDLREGEILGIVGESGCGKSVTAQCILKLNPEPPGFFGEHSSICFRGEELVSKTEKEMQAVRGAEIGFIFQDPMTSLNPTMKIGRQIEEVLKGRKGYSKKEVREKVLKILEMVGISDAKKRYKQYPYELSGGMKQRVMIAIALVGNPGIVIADEPTPGLHISAAKRVLSHFREIADGGAGVLLITHDLELALQVADRIVVFYAGTNVEEAAVSDFQKEERLRHPYTRALYRAMPSHGFEVQPGAQPYVKDLPVGCPYGPRCPMADQGCMEEIEYRAYEGGMVKCRKAGT